MPIKIEDAYLVPYRNRFFMDLPCGEEEIFALKQKEYDENMTLVQHHLGEGLGVLSKCKTQRLHSAAAASY